MPIIDQEPPPIPNDQPAVWDLVRADLLSFSTKHGNLLLMDGDMEARDRHGFEEYKVRLQAFNGRDALRDAYFEALDATVYLRQAIEEGHEDLRDSYQAALYLAGGLRMKLEERSLRGGNESEG